MAGQFFINLAARDDNDYRGLFTLDEYRAVDEFYRRRADLQPTCVVTIVLKTFAKQADWANSRESS
jgi:hypothetical protein